MSQAIQINMKIYKKTGPEKETVIGILLLGFGLRFGRLWAILGRFGGSMDGSGRLWEATDP